MSKSLAAMALVESIGIEDPSLIAEALAASEATGQDVEPWLGGGGEGSPIVHPLLSFRAERYGTEQRIALHVSTETGRLEISIAVPRPEGWQRTFNIGIHGRDMHPLTRTLARATGDGAARTIAIGQRIGQAVAAAL